MFQDGQTATVEVYSISSLLQDSRKNHELSVFPGPLKPGETHKNSKISSVAGRRDITDKESYVLLWKMLVLRVRWRTGTWDQDQGPGITPAAAQRESRAGGEIQSQQPPGQRERERGQRVQ